MEKINRKKPLVFLDVSIDGDPVERMIFELFTDFAPKTAENFRALCTGEKGLSAKTGKPLHYKGTFFHRIIKGYLAQAGDFLWRDGDFGESIYDGKFADESSKLKHDAPGLLSMAITDRDERGSLFSVTFKADHHLDRKCIVFGKLVNGHDVLNKIENSGDEEGRPSVTVKIINSGELHDDKKKGNKMGKDSIEEDGSEVRRKRKHKKSSKKRRKRKRFYTSESDSSTDTDTESSESDSDSDSFDTSLTDTSPSNDVKRKKRKRSKRNRHRRGKRKDGRHEKRRKQRNKKTKHKSKRKSCRNDVLDSESTSRSGSSSDDNAAVGELDGKLKSSVQAHKTSTTSHKEGDVADLSRREEGELPRENGDHQSNGIEREMESDRSADRYPDPVDDRPSKPRSCKLSPRRTMSKSMSISPRRIDRGSPGVGAKHSRSRRPDISRSSQQISNKSSSSPVRSGSSTGPIGSPPRSKKGRRGSIGPPVGSPSQQSVSSGATVSPPRRRVTRSPPRTSSRRSLRSASCSPVRSPQRSLSRSSGKPSQRSFSRSPKRSCHRSFSRSSGWAPPRRSTSQSPVRATNRITRRSYSRSLVSVGRRARSPVSDCGRSSSRSRSVDESPRHIRRGRGFSDRYSYVRRYRSRSPGRSPVRSYRYGGRSDRDRYSSYRRSPRRYRSPPRGRTPPRYRGRRSRTRSPVVSRSPIHYRSRPFSQSRGPIHSRSPAERYRGSPRGERRRSPSRSKSRTKSESRSSRDSQSPRCALEAGSRSSSGSSPRKTGLVSYGDGSPYSSRD